MRRINSILFLSEDSTGTGLCVNLSINCSLFYCKSSNFQIHKMDYRYNGAIPYFDMATHEIVYFKDPNYVNPADNIF